MYCGVRTQGLEYGWKIPIYVVQNKDLFRPSGVSTWRRQWTVVYLYCAILGENMSAGVGVRDTGAGLLFERLCTIPAHTKTTSVT